MARIGIMPPDTKSVRIGYYRKSDDSISSSWWQATDLRDTFVAELIADDDVLEVWFRTSDTGPATYIKSR